MEVKDGYAVFIDFDGDIYSTATGFKIFVGKNARDEVKKLLKTALHDLIEHEIIKYGRSYNELEVSKLVKNDNLLDKFINNNGQQFGNWRIEVYYTCK